MIELDTLATEQQNTASQTIDAVSTLDMVRIINAEDAKVAAAVGAIAPAVAQAVDLIAARLHDGGCLFYIGSGTSGRLGILDAVECPPTYSTEPELVQGLIAGGYDAIFRMSSEPCRMRNLSAPQRLQWTARLTRPLPHMPRLICALSSVRRLLQARRA